MGLKIFGKVRAGKNCSSLGMVLLKRCLKISFLGSGFDYTSLARVHNMIVRVILVRVR